MSRAILNHGDAMKTHKWINATAMSSIDCLTESQMVRKLDGWGLPGRQAEFVKGCVLGRFIAVINEFYAEDAFQMEADGSRRDGRERILVFQQNLLDRVTCFQVVDLLSGNLVLRERGASVLVVAYSLVAKLRNQAAMYWPEQVQVTTWSGDRIRNLHYYGRTVFCRDRCA